MKQQVLDDLVNCAVDVLGTFYDLETITANIHNGYALGITILDQAEIDGVLSLMKERGYDVGEALSNVSGGCYGGYFWDEISGMIVKAE